MITLQTLSIFLEKPLCVGNDSFVIHKCSNGEPILLDVDGNYLSNIGAINETGIAWFRFMLGTRISGVIKFSEITVI